MNQDLSVCMIVKNEEKFLESCLNKVSNYADEIIIVDTGSTDSTILIASKFSKVKLFNYKWVNDFSAARNFSITKATKNWVLILDADEELIGYENLGKYLNYSNVLYLLKVKHLNNDSNREYVHLNSRVFPNNKGFKYFGRVHENIINEDGIESTLLIDDVEIDHYGFLDLKKKHYKSKRNLTIFENHLLELYSENNSSKSAYFFRLKFLIAKEYLSQHNYKKAINYYYQCIFSNIVPLNLKVNSISMLLKVLISQKKWQEINLLGNKFENVAKSNPDFSIYWGTYLYEVAKKTEKAKYYFEVCLNFDFSENPLMIFESASITWKPYLFIGIYYFEKEKYKKSIDYLLKAKEFSSNWLIIFNLIQSYSNLGDFENADYYLNNLGNNIPAKFMDLIETKVKFRQL